MDAFSLASECLFGIDIDPWVLDAAAFVLVADSWDHLQANGIVPCERLAQATHESCLHRHSAR